MDTFQYTVFIFTFINLLIFIVMGKYFFDGSAAGRLFWAFAGTFMLVVGLTLSFLYAFGTQDRGRLTTSSCLLMASILIYFAAVVATMRAPFTAAFSPDRPSRIVTSGIYRFVRHPFYTSYILTFIGAAVATNHVLGIVDAVIPIAIYWVAARMEEKKFSTSDLARAYSDYKSRTGMFVPRFGRGA